MATWRRFGSNLSAFEGGTLDSMRPRQMSRAVVAGFNAHMERAVPILPTDDLSAAKTF